jgi:hypothetical protein
MIPLTVALFLAAPLADPLPDGKSIDTLTFSFSGGGDVHAGGSFTLTAEGKVSYSHQTAPFTGSGGVVTSKSWDIPKSEAAAVLSGLLEDGLLDLPAGGTPLASSGATIRVTSGKWFATVAAHPVPEKILGHMRPYLEKAHPAMWKKPAPPPKDAKPVLTNLRYTFTAKVEGEAVILTVARDGRVSYTRRTHPTAPGGQKNLVSQGWALPKDDAARLLNALVADGLFDLEDTLGQKFPNHGIDAHAGPWRRVSHPKDMPDAVMKHLRPLLEKADPEVWKKP